MNESVKKHLRVEYNGITLFDGEVDEVNWTDGSTGVTVNGRIRRPGSSGSAAGGFLDMLAAAAGKKPLIEQPREELNPQAVDLNA